MKQYKLIFIILTCSLLFIGSKTIAQSGKLPPFQMVLSNGNVFRANELPLGKPIMIIYFSPECEDCMEFAKELLSRINEFKNVPIAMITFLPTETVSQFVNNYKLNAYPNIYIGTEGTLFFVRKYYNIEQLPFLVIYNKNGDFIKMYKQEISLNDVIKNLRNT